ncbi:hypothetical protein GFL15_12290 [Rhizobium leguminosarum bv. viciae]|nr:ABC transporter permease [Rhizobium binae]NKL48892.1 hypothetical protein [Rhizobium leguminosarum bv. viciae]QSY85755.1 ABC transporter permease [Rhizobium binae]
MIENRHLWRRRDAAPQARGLITGASLTRPSAAIGLKPVAPHPTKPRATGTILLIGVGLLGTLRTDDPTALQASALATVLGKLLAYLILQAAVLPFYIIVLPYRYDLPRLGSPLVVLVFALPFVLAVSALGMVVAALFRSPLTVRLAFAAIGLPFFFLAGFSWPTAAMPKVLHYLAPLVPSSAAINGIVSVSQFGAPLSDVRSPFLTLWALASILWLPCDWIRNQDAANRRMMSRTPVTSDNALPCFIEGGSRMNWYFDA